MRVKYPRLIKINSSYYIRVAIPRKLQLICGRTQFKYSLKTNDYYTSIRRLKILSIFFDKIIELFRGIEMKVYKASSYIELDERDVDDIIINRLEQIYKFVENYYDEIMSGAQSWQNIALFRQDTTNCDIKDLWFFNGVVEYFNQYMSLYRVNPSTPKSIREVLNKWEMNKLSFKIPKSLDEVDDEDNPFNNLLKLIKNVENYGKQYIDDIVNGEENSPRHPRIVRLKRVLDQKRDLEHNRDSFINTKWETLFEKFIDEKKRDKDIKEKTIIAYKSKLKMCFGVLDKKFVQTITKDDCYDNFPKLIKRVPANFTVKYKNKDVLDFLLPKDEQGISDKTVQTYTILFKEFMKYAYKNVDGMDIDVSEYIKIPKINKELTVFPWEEKDLDIIFNPKTYPNRYSQETFVFFYLPLLSIFSGARLNEISQISVDDFVEIDGVQCFWITNYEPGNSVKNKNSQRLVPLHSCIIKIGFLEFVQKLKQKGVKRVFYTLKNTKGSNYGDKVSKWFGKYKESLGYKGRNRNFHSFRHNFESKLVNSGIIETVQNSICGWSNKGVGQKRYAKTDVKTMKFAIEKVQYGFFNKYFEYFKYDKNIIDEALNIK